MHLRHQGELVGLLCLLLLAVGCQSRKSLDDALTDPSAAGALAFDLSLGDFTPLTRANDYNGYDKKWTYVLSGLRIVLYHQDEAGNPTDVAYAFDKDIFSFRGARKGKDLLNRDDEGPLFSITPIEGLIPDDYSIVFFTSPTRAIIDATKVGQPFEALKEPLAIDFTKNTPGEDTHTVFPRKFGTTATNVDSPVKVTKEQLTKSSSSAPLLLDRISLTATDAMAVLRVKFDEEVQRDAGIIATPAYCKVYPEVFNKTLLLFPELDEVPESNLSVPKDANYSGMSGWTDEQYSDAFVYFPEVDYSTKLMTTFFLTPNKEVLKTATDPMILPENTTAPGEVSSKVVTRLMVGVSLAPDKYENSTDEIVNNTHWFSYRDKNYLWSQFKADYKKACDKYKQDKEQLTENEKELLKIGLAVNKAFKPENSELKEGDALLSTPKYGASSDDVRFYSFGYAFYHIPIRHFDDTQAPDLTDIGRYGVVRNTIYLLTLTSVKHIGSPTIDGIPEMDYNTFTIDQPSIVLPDLNVIEVEIGL